SKSITQLITTVSPGCTLFNVNSQGVVLSVIGVSVSSGVSLPSSGVSSSGLVGSSTTPVVGSINSSSLLQDVKRVMHTKIKIMGLIDIFIGFRFGVINLFNNTSGFW